MSDNPTLQRIIKEHTDFTFESIDILFRTFDAEQFGQAVNGFPLWQQFYHMLNSIDRIYTDPIDYQFPSFHEENMHKLESKNHTAVSKEALFLYFHEIRERVDSYLSEIDDRVFFEKSHHLTISMTKLDHVIYQLRHMAWHIGYLHSCAKVMLGEPPEHVLIRSE